ncbi:hypothetical protein [Halorubrum sp. Boch-26]|uniref:hypothetical protein n=1 Tax=Halorubrum sp. Boch-26 TaxID=2994426 RepID=UPI0024697F16|nr:hypothetical protein [Halorubrum sp. Boch-26]
MSEPARKQSLRRGAAVLLISRSGATTRPGSVEPALPGVSDAVGVALFGVAVTYLVASVGRRVAAAADAPL